MYSRNGRYKNKSIVFNIEEMYNESTLNIFCDASIARSGSSYNGCYGVVAVCMDDMLFSDFRLVSDTTNNNSEIKAIRAALSVANRFKTQFKQINIFSDSQISVYGLKYYIYNWKYNVNQKTLVSSSDKPVVNQEVFIEAHNMIVELEKYECCIISLYHQPGHIGTDYDSIIKASDVFCKSNNIRGNIDLNSIRYIGVYNNYVDNMSRSLLRRSINEVKTGNYCDPISFVATGKINKY